MPPASHDTSADPAPTSPAARRFGFYVALAVVAVAISFAAAEILLRVYFGDVSRITGATDWETASWKGLVYHWDLYHPRFGWTNRPGYRSGKDAPFQVAINGRGLRGEREVALRPESGTRRIAVFGDSLAFGEEVDDDETVPVFLERALPGSEVLNFGVHGYGLGQMLLRLEDEGFGLAPDHVVVLLMLPRDLARDLSRHFVHNKPAFAAREAELVVANLPVPEASQQPWWLRKSFAAAFLFGRAGPWVVGRDVTAQLRVLPLLLARLRDRADAEGVPVTVVSVTNGLDVRRLNDPGEREVVAKMLRSVEASGLDSLSLIDFLADRWREEGPVLSTPNWHWSRRGNCLIAEQIALHLAASRSFGSPPQASLCDPTGRPRGRAEPPDPRERTAAEALAVERRG